MKIGSLVIFTRHCPDPWSKFITEGKCIYPGDIGVIIAEYEARVSGSVTLAAYEILAKGKIVKAWRDEIIPAPELEYFSKS